MSETDHRTSTLATYLTVPGAKDDPVWTQWVIGAQFLYAYQKMRGGTLYYPEFYCLGHACEVMLKSYLTLKGMAPKALKEFAIRHSISALLDEAIARGLVIKSQHETDLREFSPFFEQFLFRYGPGQVIEKGLITGNVTTPHAERIFSAAMEVLERVNREIPEGKSAEQPTAD